MPEDKKYKVGDLITYTIFGGGSRTIKVTSKEKDVKDGRPGFTGVIVSSSDKNDTRGNNVWGYDYQIKKTKLERLS